MTGRNTDHYTTTDLSSPAAKAQLLWVASVAGDESPSCRHAPPPARTGEVHTVQWLGRRVVAATTQVRLLVWTWWNNVPPEARVHRGARKGWTPGAAGKWLGELPRLLAAANGLSSPRRLRASAAHAHPQACPSSTGSSAVSSLYLLSRRSRVWGSCGLLTAFPGGPVVSRSCRLLASASSGGPALPRPAARSGRW